MVIAEKIRQHAISTNGKETLAMDGAAEAMESMYRTLAENSGSNPIDASVSIKKSMADKNIEMKRNVPTIQLSSMLKRAMESSIGMLRTDEVLNP